MNKSTNKTVKTTCKSANKTVNREVNLSADQFSQLLSEYTSERMSGFHPSADTSRVRSEWSTDQVNFQMADFKTIVNRSYNAYKSNTYLKSAVEVLKANIIEKGIKPKPVICKENGEINKELNNEIIGQWNKFNDFAFADNKTVYQKQNTILTSVVVTGNCFILKTLSKKKNSPFSFGLKLLDSRHLDYTKDTFTANKDGSYIKKGIKYNIDDEPVEYYFTKYKNAISADRVIHVYNEDLADETFGNPLFLQSLPMIYDIENIIKYQLLSTRLTAGIALWIKKGEGYSIKSASPLQIYESDVKPEVIGGDTGKVSSEITLIEHCLTSIASSLGLSKAALTRDSKENFSGARLRSLNDQLAFDTFNKFLCKSAFHPIYVWFLEDIIRQGLISLKATQYYKDVWTYQQCYFQSFQKGYIDPLDQTRTDIERIEGKLTSYKDYYSSKGKDWKVELSQIAEEAKYMQDIGLTPKDVNDSIARKSQSQVEKEVELRDEELLTGDR